jgi:hypothetical protein
MTISPGIVKTEPLFLNICDVALQVSPEQLDRLRVIELRSASDNLKPLQGQDAGIPKIGGASRSAGQS